MFVVLCLREYLTMKSQYLQNPPVVVRAKTSSWYTGFAALVGLVVLVSLTVDGGFPALVRGGGAVLFLTYSVWYLLGRPALVVDRDVLTVINPFVTYRVNYAALIDVSTRFHLTLVTASGRYQAFAVPSSGMVAGLSAHRQDLRNLPPITYGAEQSVRTSDLPNSLAGSAAALVRGYWQEQVEDGALDALAPSESRSFDGRGALVFALLLVLALVGLLV